MTQYKMSDKNTKSNEHIEEQNPQKNTKNGQQANLDAKKSHSSGSKVQEKPGSSLSQLLVRHDAQGQQAGAHLGSLVGSTNGPSTLSDGQMLALSQEEKSNNLGVDSDSQGSSSNAFAEPPSIGDVHDDLSELSDLELNFDGPIEWPEGDLMAAEGDMMKGMKSTAPLLENAAAKLLLYQEESADMKSVDPRTQARLEALLEAAGIGKLSTTDGKAFADPEVLRKLTSSVSCALDEAAAALTRMRAETQPNSTQNDRTLAEACSDGDIEAVKRLLSEGRSVHETTEEGESLLSLACSAGYYELAEVLLRMRANVEDRGIKGDCTPLMEAASGGFVDIARLLIAYDADVNAQSSAGHTALHHAAVGGYEDVVQVLIAAGANVEEQNENGHTPLMESASAGHVGVAKILLDAGAGINTHSNEFKESALTLACYKGHLDMVKFLLDAGADQEHKTDEMHTALMEASMDGHVEVARLLLDSGAQVNMPADSFESPLTLAACGGHVELANLLIERGANLEEVNDEGYTPLMEAAREGHEEMVALLLAHGAEVNAQTDETQETALTLACCGGFLEVAHFLIRAHADIEKGCSTPLMEASQEGHLDLVKYLIKQGSDVQAMTGTGDSALTYACENGHTDVADVLLQAGAKLEHESEGGRTPLMKAARAGHLCTVQFLISKGANVNRSTTNNEHTVLSLACAGGHLGVVELLLEHGADPMHKLKDGSTMLIEAAKGGHTTVVNLLLDYPQGLPKTLAAASEYEDSIPMADNLPADSKDLTLRTTESLASRLEQFIHKMMSQAENSSGTREEQMARKQEILEELQRVEQELKFRTQMAQDSSQPVPPPSLDCQEDTPAPPPSASLSESPPNISPSHEYVEQELAHKQAIAEQQRQEQQLQQQKEYYQAKLQHLKQQYQQKQLQLQQQRQQLLSQAAASNHSVAADGQTDADGAESAKRQPIPLHIALQNHLHAHHVTEGNVNDLAQALQDWDTRDRNINLPQSQVKPMPAFNLSTKPDEEPVPEPVPASIPLRVEDLPMTETPPSRSLADSLAALIQGMDYKPNNFDSSLEGAIESTSNLKRPPSEYEMTIKTLQWLKKVDSGCYDEPAEPAPPIAPAPAAPAPPKPKPANPGLMTVPKPTTKKVNESLDKGSNTTKITKVPNGYVEAPVAKVSNTDPVVPHTGRGGTIIPSPQRSVSPPRVPYVDPNAETDSNHDTALTLACAGGHAELVKLLLSRNAEIEHRDKKGFTPLILASTAGHAEVVEILIDHAADIEAQSERTKDTPLSLACSGGRYEVVEILLRLGANKEHRNVSDYTPLSLAASGGYVNIIKLLLSYGAEINSRTGSKLGISPLMLAAMNGHTAAVKLLLDMGSDINAQIETNRNTALTLACFQGRHDVVSLLVDRKANIEHRAKTGLTPLMEAASGGYVEVGRVLLDKGADVNAPPVPSSKDTALTIAADKGHYRFVELLLSRGAAVDVKNKKGNSPLWLACNGGHLDVVQLLVSNRADIDSQDNRRVSSLMTAFRKGHIKVVKWLVRHVTQFPSDQECGRYIATVNDKELLKKCQQCMGIIVQAKEHQAREALKNASILLEQIEVEKSREEKRKEAAARKREKKKQKRKEKQAEQSDKASPEPEVIERDPSPPPPPERKSKERSSSPPVEPDDIITEPQATTSEPVSKKTNSNGRAKRQPNQNKADKNANTKEERSNDVINKENMAAKRNRRNKTTTRQQGNKGEQQSDEQQRESNHGSNARNRTTSIGELDVFPDLPLIPNGKAGGKAGSKRDRGMSNISQLDTFDNVPVNKYVSPNKTTPSKSSGVNPSPGKKKREDGWKEVSRKSKKVVAVPGNVVGRLSKSLSVINKMYGAHLEFEKSDKKGGDKTLIIKGSADATKNAHNLITLLLKDPDREFEAQLGIKKGSGGGSAAAAAAAAASASATNNGVPPATSTANQPSTSIANAQPQDTMSSIGTFSIADFIVTTQIAAPTETKAKTIQSKPGWPVRPAVSQSAWGQPISSTVSQQPQPPVNMSPRAQRPVAPAAVRMPVAQPTPPKLPSDVSRQLFPEGNSQVPASQPVTSKPRAPVAPVQRPVEHVPPPQPMPAYVSQGQAYIPTMQGNETKSYMSAPVQRAPAPIGSAPAPIGSVNKMQQRPNPAYSPFIDSHMSKPIQLPSQPHIMSNATSMMGYPPSMGQHQPDPTKAPGFRPTAVSPQLSQYSQHLVLQTAGSVGDDFSRAPGSRSGPEHLTSPLSNHTISSNVHTLFSNSTQSPRGNVPSHAVANMHGLMPPLQNHYGSHYSTRDQPMTLPEISSSLNPNASEFNIPHKMGNEGQHSPRNMGGMGNKQQTSPIEYKQQQFSGNSGLNHRPVSADNAELIRQMMFANSSPGMPQQSMNPMTGLLQAAPGQMPIGMQPQRTYSPASSRQMMTPPMDPTLTHQLDDSPPSLQSNAMENKGPMPIGGERSRRTPVFADPVESAIWSTNPSDQDWATMINPMQDPVTSSLMSTGNQMSDPALIQSIFKTDGALLSNLSGQFFYPGGLSGGGGDGLQNTWNNSPSKMAHTQEWPTWNQPNNSG